MAIHPTAVIHDSAQIEPSVQIGPYVVIEQDVVIGANCRIWQNATICQGTTLGEGNQVHMGAVIGHVPQDLAFEGKPSYTKIGNENIFREYTTIHRGTSPGSETVIGNKNFFMALSHAGHNCRIGNENIIANGALLAGHVEMEDKAFISGNCVVHQFVRIGKMAMMSGGSRVNKDIPPFMLLDGDSLIAAINVVALRRGGLTPANRKAIKQAYEILYRQNLSVSSALEKLAALKEDPEIAHLIKFIETSKRGICRHRRVGETGKRSDAPEEAETPLEI